MRTYRVSSLLFIPLSRKIIGNRSLNSIQLFQLAVNPAVVAGMHNVKSGDIFNILPAQLQRLFSGDSATIGADKHTVSIFQPDHRIPVRSCYAPGTRKRNVHFREGRLNARRHVVCAESAHILALCAQHRRIYRYIQRLSARIHPLLVNIHVADIIAKSQYPCHTLSSLSPLLRQIHLIRNTVQRQQAFHKGQLLADSGFQRQFL